MFQNIRLKTLTPLSYSLLQEENQKQKEYIQLLQGKLEGQRATIDSLRDQIVGMETATVEEKTALLDQVGQMQSEMKQATRKKIGRKRVTEKDGKQDVDKLICRLRDQKKTQRQIATEVGVSVATVNRILKKLDGMKPQE